MTPLVMKNDTIGQNTYVISQQLGAPHSVAQWSPLQGGNRLQPHQAVPQARMVSEAVAGSSSTAVDGLHHHLLQVVTAPAGYLVSFLLASIEVSDIRNILGITISFLFI